LWQSRFPGNFGVQENAGRILCHHTGPLKNGINPCEEARRDDPFQQINPKMGDCQGSFDMKTKVCQPSMDTARMKVKVQSSEFHRFWGERAPGLEAQHITKNGFDIAFIGEFQDKTRARVQDIPYLAQRSRSISHMMQDANHGRGIEQSIHERQPVDVSCHIGVAIGSPQEFLGLFQLRAGIVQQDYMVKAAVPPGVTSGSGSKFQ
jgi:hypothetical protein